MGRREAPLQAAVEALAAENIVAAYATGDVRNAEDCQRVVKAAVQKYVGRARVPEALWVRGRGLD